MLLFDGVHLTSDANLDELLTEASRLGLKPHWLQCPAGGIVHFDVWDAPALRLQVNCTAREIVKRGLREKGEDHA